MLAEQIEKIIEKELKMADEHDIRYCRYCHKFLAQAIASKLYLREDKIREILTNAQLSHKLGWMTLQQTEKYSKFLAENSKEIIGVRE